MWKTSHKKRRTSGSTVIGVMIAISWTHPAPAAPWDFGAVVDLGVIYSDNLRLAPDGSEENEFVYSIAPAFSLSTEGDRLTADIGYRPQAFFYDTAPESDSIFHVLDASATGTVVRDSLFVFVSAANYQSIVTPNAGIATSNLPITGNRIDSRILQIRPYWQQNVGFADVLAEVAYTDTQYDELDDTRAAFTQDNNERLARFDLNNHSRQEGIAWGINYLYQRTEYDEAIPWDYQRASANLGYWVNGTTRIFASGGLETAFDNYFESDLDDEFWEVGFQYRPNQRLDMEIAIGERGYGESYRARISYELRRGQSTLTYTEDPATRGGLQSGRRPILDTDNLDDFLNQPGQSDRFIRKRGQWTTQFELARSDLSFRLFAEERSDRTTATGDALENEELSGAAFRWAWRFGAKSNLGFVADYTNRESGLTDDRLIRVSVDYSYRLTERLRIVATVQRSDDDGANAGSGYVENQYGLKLRAVF